MRNAAIISGGLHVAVITIAFIGLPSLFRPTPPVEEVVVEMVSLDKDLPKPKKKVPPKPPEKPKPPPKPEVKAPPPPPPPEPLELASKPPEPLPVPKPKPAPPKPVVKAKPKPEPKPEPKPAPPKVEAKAETKTPPPKPKRRPKPPPDELQAILKNLAKERQRHEKAPPKQQPKAKVAAAAPEKPTAPAMSQVEANRLQAQLADMVRRQVSPCWSLPAGAKNAEEMRIIIRVYLNPDGSLRGAPRVENTARMSTDSFFRAAAESAMRALLNPRCKLSLPVAYYDTWKEIALNFDPKQMLGP